MVQKIKVEMEVKTLSGSVFNTGITASWQDFLDDGDVPSWKDREANSLEDVADLFDMFANDWPTFDDVTLRNPDTFGVVKIKTENIEYFQIKHEIIEVED